MVAEEVVVVLLVPQYFREEKSEQGHCHLLLCSAHPGFLLLSIADEEQDPQRGTSGLNCHACSCEMLTHMVQHRTGSDSPVALNLPKVPQA